MILWEQAAKAFEVGLLRDKLSLTQNFTGSDLFCFELSVRIGFSLINPLHSGNP